MTPKQALEEAKYIVYLCKAGKFTYDEAKAKCVPLLAMVNNAGKKIAKEYGQRYKPIGFSGLLR